MRSTWSQPDDRQLDLPGALATPPATSVAPPMGKPPARSAARDRVSVDLRGLGQHLRAQAERQRTTPAALTRWAVQRMLDADPDSAKGGTGIGRAFERAGPIVKVTLRLSAAHAAVLAARARASDVAQGDYVCALLDGMPPAPQPADHAASVGALMASTDRLAAMSADLNAFLRLLGRVPSEQLKGYRAGLVSLATEVRAHLASAAAMIAELRPVRRPRR